MKNGAANSVQTAGTPVSATQQKDFLSNYSHESKRKKRQLAKNMDALAGNMRPKFCCRPAENAHTNKQKENDNVRCAFEVRAMACLVLERHTKNGRSKKSLSHRERCLLWKEGEC
jgi:hypothetical protein